MIFLLKFHILSIENIASDNIFFYSNQNNYSAAFKDSEIKKSSHFLRRKRGIKDKKFRIHERAHSRAVHNSPREPLDQAAYRSRA